MAYGIADEALLTVLVHVSEDFSVLVDENRYFGKIKTKWNIPDKDKSKYQNIAALVQAWFCPWISSTEFAITCLQYQQQHPNGWIVIVLK